MQHGRGVGYQKVTEVEDGVENKGGNDYKTHFLQVCLDSI